MKLQFFQKNPRSIVVLCFVGLCLHTGAVSAQDTWHASRSLKPKEGVDSVKVRRLESTERQLQYEYSFPDVSVAGKRERTDQGEIEHRINFGNAPKHVRPGEPVVPVVPLQFVLPKGQTIASVTVNPGNAKKVPGTYLIEHGQEPVPIRPGNKPGKTPRSERIYSSDDRYPKTQYEVVGIQHKRGVAIVLVNLFPVRYHPRSGDLYRYETMAITVSLKPESSTDKTQLRHNRRNTVNPALFPSVENPEELSAYEGADPESSNGEPLPTGTLCDPSKSYQYVIVTAEAFRIATTDYTVRDLLAHKQAKGISGTIVSIESVLENYSGRDDAEKLRNFIIDAYRNWETDYVLLGGDINVIPMRMLWANNQNSPSDLYYQCLDGTFNHDNDAYWGEPNDGPGGGECDFMAEVYVGRASAENRAEMSNFVYKTLAYENGPDNAPYLNRALLAGEHLGWGGIAEYANSYLEEQRLGSSAHGYTTKGFAAMPSIVADTLYDSPDYEWSNNVLIDMMNNGTYGMYSHLGHANWFTVMKIWQQDLPKIQNNGNFFFIYSQGCKAGEFDEPQGCMAEFLTTSSRHGAFAVVMNSRNGYGAGYSTDGPSQRLHRQFWDAYFGESMRHLGKLNADSHEDNVWDLGWTRMVIYVSNLHGDPETSLRNGTGEPDPSVHIEAEDYSRKYGYVRKVACSEGGLCLAKIRNRNYTVYNNVDFGSSGISTFSARIAGDRARLRPVFG